MQLLFKGRVAGIGNVKEGKTQAGKDWATRSFKVKEEADQYPQEAIFKLFKMNENTKFVHETGFKVGDLVEVEFNLKVNSFKTKAGKEMETTEVNAWKVNVLEGSNETNTSSMSDEPMDDDDLPF